MRGLLLAITTTLALGSVAQDLHFSQISRTPLVFNPAHTAATNADHRATAHFRSQWFTIAKSYMTYGASYDFKIRKQRWKNKHIGLGVIGLNDQAGDVGIRRIKGDILASYHQRLGERHFLGGGIRVGFLQHSIDFSNAQWDNQYDGTGFNSNYSSGESRQAGAFWTVDAAAGILYSFVMSDNHVMGRNQNMFQLGASMAHLSMPRVSFYTGEKYEFRYMVHGIGSFSIPNKNIAIRPSFMLQLMGAEYEVVVGTNLRHVLREGSHQSGLMDRVELSYGVYYRFLTDAVAPNFYFGYGQWGLGVSYDFNVSKLRTASNYQGGVEVSLRFAAINPYKVQRFSYPSI